jgi:hypothetical protein
MYYKDTKIAGMREVSPYFKNLMNELNLKINEKNFKINKEMVQIILYN